MNNEFISNWLKEEVVTLDEGCAERSCACYSPQFGDTGGIPHYPETVVLKLLDRIKHLEELLGSDPAYYE
jgi:hypothetical protein